MIDILFALLLRSGKSAPNYFPAANLLAAV
jgi:hypothetical protein